MPSIRSVAQSGRSEHRFAAMGTRAHVIVEACADRGLLDWAVRHVDELEAQWSRFRSGSDIARLNSASGQPVEVATSTIELIDRAVDAWYLTQGHFDPTMLHQLIHAGYDRPYDRMTDRCQDEPLPTRHALGCSGIDIDRSASTVTLPPGMAFDPGGIGKGLAADIVSASLIERGARRALVNLGGDLRLRSTESDAEPWPIEILEPHCAAAQPTVVRLVDGGVATSTVAKRRWRVGEHERHHLLDPRSGQPRRDGPVLTSSIAADAWWAEVTATAATAPTMPHLDGVAIRRVFESGAVEYVGRFDRYEW